jgi:enoyl-CoA hydratase
MLPAERAAQFGLVNILADSGKALESALALAGKLQANGPMALIASKQVASQSHVWQDDDMFERQAKYTAAIFASDDAREGARAFTEKRVPVWQGR